MSEMVLDQMTGLYLPAGIERTCLACGCTDDEPCLDDEGVPCGWARASLCTACVEIGGEA